MTDDKHVELLKKLIAHVKDLENTYGLINEQIKVLTEKCKNLESSFEDIQEAEKLFCVSKVYSNEIDFLIELLKKEVTI